MWSGLLHRPFLALRIRARFNCAVTKHRTVTPLGARRAVSSKERSCAKPPAAPRGSSAVASCLPNYSTRAATDTYLYGVMEGGDALQADAPINEEAVETLPGGSTSAGGTQGPASDQRPSTADAAEGAERTYGPLESRGAGEGRKGGRRRGGSRRGSGDGGGRGQQQQQQQHQQANFVPSDLPPGTVIEDASSAPQPQDYVFVDGLRLVRPYFFDFKCFVKARQDGRPLMQLMAEEFPMLSHDYYTRAVATGRLRVEGRAAAAAFGRDGGWSAERPLRSGMCIRHFIHRHEPPVLAGDVEILGVTDDFVAVNKPACVPVHTVGQYRKNTVMGIVQASRPDLWPLYPTYRLDKPVSGVLLLARSSAAAARMRVLLEERGCSKAYVARVEGVFPDTGTDLPPLAMAAAADATAAAAAGGEDAPSAGSEAAGPGADASGGGDGGACGVSRSGPPSGGTPLVVDVPLGWDAKTNHATPVPEDAAARSRLPAELVASAKPAVTLFRRLSVAPDGKTSVVEAVPLTGRTHQIRVHLQHVGHPIANDTQYGGRYGLPLFFRRGMGGPARPHVNGLRRQHAEQQQQQQDDAPAATSTPVDPSTGARDDQQGQQHEHYHQQEHQQGPTASTAAVQGAGACACEPTSSGNGGAGGGGATPGGGLPGAREQGRQGQQGGGEAAPERKRQRCDEGPPRHGAVEAAPGGPQAHQPPLGPIACGPNVDPALIAASSQRYLDLYTQPQFQVEGGTRDPLCPHCPCLVPEGYPIDLEPLWLHARRYAREPKDNAAAAAAAAGHVAAGAAATAAAGSEGGKVEAPPSAVQGGGGPEGGQGGGDGGAAGAGAGAAEGWCFEAPLPRWAWPGYVAVAAARAGGGGGVGAGGGGGEAVAAGGGGEVEVGA